MTHLINHTTILLLCILSFTDADIKWPSYSQQCADDAGPPYGDDEETFPNGKKYHDGSAAIPTLLNGECAPPLKGACVDRPTIKTAYLEGPIDCGDKGWYCRIMPNPSWPPLNLNNDLNFNHCNTTDAFGDAVDSIGHCHGSSKDNTYYWWVRDHWFRQYNGNLRCCCGWYKGSSTTSMTDGRITDRCDYRRQVTKDENLDNCRDANEEDVNNNPHELKYEGGCKSKFKSQIGQPIPEDDSICWEVQYFGDGGGDDDDNIGDDDIGDDDGENPEDSEDEENNEDSEDEENNEDSEDEENPEDSEDEENNEDSEDEENSEDEEGVECEGITKKNKCNKVAECTWDANEKACVEACDGQDCDNEEDSEDEENSEDEKECEEIARRKDCMRSPDCTWDKSAKVCMEEDETPSTECEEITKKGKCNKITECTWDVSEKVCVEACDEEDCDNEEDSEDGGNSEDEEDSEDDGECEKIASKKGCKKNSECTWNKSTRVCIKEDSSSTECGEFTRKGKCKKSSGCTWDNDENICIEEEIIQEGGRKLLRGG